MARVAIVGPGAIGVTFAAAVQQAGNADLVICARRPLGSITVTRDGQRPVAVTAPVLTDPAQVAEPVAWVFLAVKAHQTAGAGRWLSSLTRDGSVVVVMQNGVEQREIVAPLAAAGAVVLPAAVWCPAEMTAPGQVRLRGEPRLSVPAGQPGGALAALLGGAARVDRTDDFTTEAWRKLCVNAVAGLMVLAGRRAAMFQRADIAVLVRRLAAECIAVGRAEGARLADADAEQILAWCLALPADQTTSILRDREAGLRLEWEARNAVVQKLGARHGIPTPVSDVIVPLLAAASGESTCGLPLGAMGDSSSSKVADLLLTVDRAGVEPLHRQIATSIRDGIRTGRLPHGSALPPTRALAVSLDLSRGVVVEAYQQLKAEGYLTSRPGGYTEVAVGRTSALPARDPGVRRPEPRIDFRYGRADPQQFPRAMWLRSARRVLTNAPNERFGYISAEGVPELRRELANYLNRVRGTVARPADVMICSGFAQGVSLLLQVLADSGVRRVAVEDPSPSDDLRPLARLTGSELVPVPVGPAGLRVDALERAGVGAVIVTPSHQWPTGAVLGPAGRADLLEWARRTGGLVIEDDYDAEFRYDRAPVGALQGLNPDQVVYTGTASKTLAPGLRLGWLILPPRLIGQVAAAKVAADRGSPVIDQLTFADFLSRGEFDRHLRRMRPVYRRRRDALLAALGRYLPQWRPDGISAGFHLITWLPPGLDEDSVVARAAGAGVGVYGVAKYRMAPGPPALLFGYAGLNEAAITEGVRLLAGAIT